MSLFLPFCSWSCFMTRIILHVSAALCIYPASLQSRYIVLWKFVAVMHLFLNTPHLSISISAFSMSILYVQSFFISLYIYCPYLCNCFYFLYWCFAALFWAYLQLWAFYFSVHSLCVYDLFAYLYGYFASHYGHLISLCGYYAQSLYWRFVCLHNFMFMVVLFLLSPVILHLFMDTLDLFVVFCGGLMDLCSP